MGGVNGHTHPLELVFVHLISAALRQSFNQADYLYPGLQGMVARNQADVAPAYDKEALRGPDQIPVYQSLESSRAVNSG